MEERKMSDDHPLRQPAPDVVEAEQTWWMIERHDLEPSPQYFHWTYGPGVLNAWPHGTHAWSPDWQQGERFPTREAAEAHTNGDAMLSVVEHGYMQAALQARSDARTHDDALEDAVIERCAQVCENIYNGEGYAAGDWPTPDECAAAIRDMKGKAKP